MLDQIGTTPPESGPLTTTVRLVKFPYDADILRTWLPARQAIFDKIFLESLRHVRPNF